MAAAPPPDAGTVVVVLPVVPVFPVVVVVGEVRGPLVDEGVGVMIVPVVGLMEIGGFRPEVKPDVALPDCTGPVSPKDPNSPAL